MLKLNKNMYTKLWKKKNMYMVLVDQIFLHIYIHIYIHTYTDIHSTFPHRYMIYTFT